MINLCKYGICEATLASTSKMSSLLVRMRTLASAILIYIQMGVNLKIPGESCFMQFDWPSIIYLMERFLNSSELSKFSPSCDQVKSLNSIRNTDVLHMFAVIVN